MMRSRSFLLHDKNEPKNVPQNQTILHLSLKCEHKRHEAASMPKHGLLDSLRSLPRIIHLSDSFRFDLRVTKDRSNASQLEEVRSWMTDGTKLHG